MQVILFAELPVHCASWALTDWIAVFAKYPSKISGRYSDNILLLPLTFLMTCENLRKTTKMRPVTFLPQNAHRHLLMMHELVVMMRTVFVLIFICWSVITLPIALFGWGISVFLLNFWATEVLNPIATTTLQLALFFMSPTAAEDGHPPYRTQENSGHKRQTKRP
jgi:hypothetical protein